MQVNRGMSVNSQVMQACHPAVPLCSQGLLAALLMHAQRMAGVTTWDTAALRGSSALCAIACFLMSCTPRAAQRVQMTMQRTHVSCKCCIHAAFELSMLRPLLLSRRCEFGCVYAC